MGHTTNRTTLRQCTSRTSSIRTADASVGPSRTQATTQETAWSHTKENHSRQKGTLNNPDKICH
jgi:hypothetical protein